MLDNDELQAEQTIYKGNEIITVRAGVARWTGLNIGQMFEKCLAMNDKGNPYGLSTNDDIVDPHMLKNTEWGAIVYLTTSSYGIGNEHEVRRGEYDRDFDPDYSNTKNVTGVYSLCEYEGEYVAAYRLTDYDRELWVGGDLVAPYTKEKYRNVYKTENVDGTITSSYVAGRRILKGSLEIYGDAVYETSFWQPGDNEKDYDYYDSDGERLGAGIGPTGWNYDLTRMPNEGDFFVRGVAPAGGSGPIGIFSYVGRTGVEYDVYYAPGFRICIAIS